ncbi:MAG TPA: hypothetical protein VFA27_13295, partial [Vicinamibacterales bacterium]|nr:hypothetical protein [Vicinamibacterales bacterium]
MTTRGAVLCGRTIVAVALFALSAASARAQGTDRFFIGAGIGIGVDDLVERASQSYPGLADSLGHAWIVDGGGWVTPRVALGGEVVQPPAIAAGVGRAVQTIDETERETAVLAAVAVRAFAGRTVAVDVVAGGGVLISDRQIHATLFIPPQDSESDTSEHKTSPAFLVGLDVPLHAAAHLELVPL